MGYTFEYETQGAATFLIYEKKEQDIVDTMTMGMISNNKIDGILPFIYVQIDEKTYFKYNVSSQNTLEQYFSGIVTKSRFLTVIKNLLSSFILAEEYMLETSAVVLKTPYIFVNPHTSETSVVVLPIMRENEGTVEEFMRNLVFSTQFDQTEDCTYIAALINFLNSNPFFSIHKFKELVEDLLKEKPKMQNSGTVSRVTEMKGANATPESSVSLKKVSPPVPTAVEKKEQVLPCAETPESSMMAQRTELPVPPAAKPSRKEEKGKEKKSLFGKREKTEKTETPLKKGVIAPPPFYSSSEQLASDNGSSAKTVDHPAKEKKALFGKKEQPKKQTSMAIPGMAIPNQQITPMTVQQTESKIQENPSKIQTAIPTQEVKMQKHSVATQNFGETTVLNSPVFGETTVLDAMNPLQKAQPQLIRSKNNERILLNKPVFRIGKERSYVDYFISDNTAISRSHANIITREQNYFLVDTNSTNHTFVNGTMIRSNEEVQINPGDMIRLANEDFEFKID